MDMILKFSADEAGVSAVEYAILLTFIALAIAGSVLSLGNTVRGIFDHAVEIFPGT